MSDDPRYPVGKPEIRTGLTRGERDALIAEIAATPENFRAAFNGLSEAQLDTPYRDGGWTLRQVAHHLPDSHLNAYVRLKLALTEDTPTIKPYEEARWAELADSKAPIPVSLALLDAIHERWSILLRSMADADFARTLHHPEAGTRDLDWLLQLYAWHGRHHTAHVTSLRAQKGW